MANRDRQQEVEQGPFQDRNDRWHNPDGSFASPTEIAQYESMEGQEPGQNSRFRASNRRGNQGQQQPRQPRPGGQQPSRQSRRPQSTPEPEAEPEEAEEGEEELEEATSSQARIGDLMNELFDLHERMGQVAAEIENEIGEAIEPVMNLLARLVPGKAGTAAQTPSRRAAAKQSGGNRGGNQGGRRQADPRTDKRLKPETRRQRIQEQEEEPDDE